MLNKYLTFTILFYGILWIHVTYFHKCFRCSSIRIQIFYYHTNVELLFKIGKGNGMEGNAPFNVQPSNFVWKCGFTTDKSCCFFSCLFWTSVLCLIICNIVHTLATYLPGPVISVSDGFVRHSPSFSILLFMLFSEWQHTRCVHPFIHSVHQIPIPIGLLILCCKHQFNHTTFCWSILEWKLFIFDDTKWMSRFDWDFFLAALSARSSQWVNKSHLDFEAMV